MTNLRLLARSLVLLGLLAPAVAHAQQPELGHKMLGTVGLEAGSQPQPGLYLLDRLLWFSANAVHDRDGNPIPVNLDMDAVSNMFGVAGSFRLPLSTYFNFSVGVPLSRIRASKDRPDVSVDTFGLADTYLQPIKLGWRFSQLDLVVGYAVYIPTGHFQPFAGSVGRGQWSHELSAGSTAYFDPGRTWSLSALFSYEHNLPKRGIDITRGDTVQVQGGTGKKLADFLQLGITGYALWQVEDNSGKDLPPVLRGALDRAFGLGVQANLLLPSIRSKLNLSYSHDIVARSRSVGQVVLVGLTVAAWKPDGG